MNRRHLALLAGLTLPGSVSAEEAETVDLHNLSLQMQTQCEVSGINTIQYREALEEAVAELAVVTEDISTVELHQEARVDAETRLSAAEEAFNSIPGTVQELDRVARGTLFGESSSVRRGLKRQDELEDQLDLVEAHNNWLMVNPTTVRKIEMDEDAATAEVIEARVYAIYNILEGRGVNCEQFVRDYSARNEGALAPADLRKNDMKTKDEEVVTSSAEAYMPAEDKNATKDYKALSVDQRFNARDHDLRERAEGLSTRMGMGLSEFEAYIEDELQ